MNNQKLGFLLLFIVMFISVLFFSQSSFLIPNGYELAIDGYLISRTLLLIFMLYLISKIAFLQLKK